MKRIDKLYTQPSIFVALKKDDSTNLVTDKITYDKYKIYQEREENSVEVQ